MREGLFLLSAAAYIPHPDKRETGGEDAYFISKDRLSLGIADGVGGWQLFPGSDAARYSRELMNLSNFYSYLDYPSDILNAAFLKMNESIIGSSTAVIAKLRDHKLHFFSVGDSSCSVYRNFSIISSTTVTTHSFNFPFQLGYNSLTTPANGTSDICDVEAGDVLVCGSDGLWDNLWQEDIKRILRESSSKSDHRFVVEAANRLSEAAIQAGSQTLSETPFSSAAVINGFDYTGGKLDDTTVVVCIVIDADEAVL